MYQAIYKLLGYRSSASSRPSRNQKSARRPFRPGFDQLELRDVPAAVLALQMAAAPPTLSVGQTAPNASLSSPPVVVQPISIQPVDPTGGIRPVPPPANPPPPNVESGPTPVGQDPNGPEPYRLPPDQVGPQQPPPSVPPSAPPSAPDVPSGPTPAGQDPNGPEPYRLYSQYGPGSANDPTVLQGQNGGPVVMATPNFLPFRIEVKDGKVTFVYPDGTRITPEEKKDGNVTISIVTITLPNGATYGSKTVTYPGKTTVETYKIDKNGHKETVYYSEDDGTTKTEWVKNNDGMGWTKTVTKKGETPKSEPSIGPPSRPK